MTSKAGLMDIYIELCFPIMKDAPSLRVPMEHLQMITY